jgi:hypothetical protein
VSFIASGTESSGESENGIGEHHILQARVAIVEEEVAHRHQARELPLGIHHEDVGHEARAHHRAQRLDGVAHHDLGPEDGGRGLHRLPDGALGELVVAAPLLGHFRRRGGGDQPALPLSISRRIDWTMRGIQHQQRRDGIGGQGALQDRGRLDGREPADLGGERGARSAARLRWAV